MAQKISKASGFMVNRPKTKPKMRNMYPTKIPEPEFALVAFILIFLLAIGGLNNTQVAKVVLAMPSIHS